MINRTACAWLLLLFVVPALEGAQEPVTSSRLVIQTIGGFLGQMEGFCEAPGGPYDWPALPAAPDGGKAAEFTDCSEVKNAAQRPRWLGGAVGAADLLRNRKGSLLIVGGDNQPARVGDWGFWSELADMKPDVVALGTEDLVRHLRGETGSPRNLLTFVNRSRGLPLLATNVAIRRTAPKLNSVSGKSDGYEILIDRDTSVSWLGMLRIAAPPGAAFRLLLEEFPAGPPDSPVKADTTTGTASSTGVASITFAGGFRPATWHRVTLNDATGLPKAQATFLTDAALTPMSDASQFERFPVKILQTDFKWRLLAVAMVDPGARSELAAAAWRWEEGDGTRELVIMDPKRTFGAIHARGGEDKATPLVPVLISGLEDTDTVQLLDAVPATRFVILHPESRLIGRAAPERHPAFSGDLGFVTVMDGQYPVATRVMARPEWFGETVPTIEVNVDLSKTPQVRLTDVRPTLTLVPGAELQESIVGQQVDYTAVTTDRTMPVGRGTTYLNCPGNGGLCEAFRRMWGDKSELLAVLGDAARHAFGAHITMIPSDIIDEDYRIWMKAAVEKKGTAWISEHIVDKLL